MPNISISDQDFREMPHELQRLLRQYLDNKFALKNPKPLRLECIPSSSIIPIELALAVLRNLKPESIEILKQCMDGIPRVRLVGFLRDQKKAGLVDGNEEELEEKLQDFENKINPIIGAINRRFSYRFDKRIYSISNIKLINRITRKDNSNKNKGVTLSHFYSLMDTHILPFKFALAAMHQAIDLEDKDYRFEFGQFSDLRLSSKSFTEFIDGKGQFSLLERSPEPPIDFLSAELNASFTMDEPLLVHSSGDTLSITQSGEEIVIWQTSGDATNQKVSINSENIEEMISKSRFMPVL